MGKSKYQTIILLVIIFISIIFISSNDLLARDIFELVKDGNQDEIEEALNSGADVNSSDNEGRSPLMIASRYNNDLEVIKILLDQGANVNSRDDSGHSSLMYSLAEDNVNQKVTKVLIEAGANVNIKNIEGFSPLILASMGNRLEAIELLIDAGAELNTRDGILGYTSLIWAIERGNEKAAKLLIEFGADVNVRAESNMSYSPIIHAIINQKPGILSRLLSAGARANEVVDDYFKRTPLMYVAKEIEDEEIAKNMIDVLLEFGADGALTCMEGKTAFDYAKENDKLKDTDAY